MVPKKKTPFLDRIGLVIIGGGASLFYYYLEKSVASGQSLGSFVTIALILIISLFTQLLINNINRFNRSNGRYTPIFDQNGQEINVGNISCPSCHNAHQWSPFSSGTTPGQNQPDNSNGIDKFRFLRNMSKDLVCIDCHGTQSLYRYLYFHSPDKREKMKFIPAHQARKRGSIF